MTTGWPDLRDALRRCRRAPGVTAAVLVMLTIGLGANTAVFSLVNALYLKALPVGDPARFVRVTGEAWFTTGVWEHVRDRQQVVESVTAVGSDRFNLGRGGIARYATALVVGGDFFDVLQVRPHLGRPLTRADDAPAAPAVAVIGFAFWRRELDGRSDVLGQVVWLDGQPFEIAGVLPRAFTGIEIGRQVDVVVPMATLARMPGRAVQLQPQAAWLHVFARLRPGQAIDAAAEELRAWQPALAAATRPPGGAPGTSADRHLRQPLGLIPAATGISDVRNRYGRAILVMFGVAAVVLLVACTNLAALVFARAVERRLEMDIRRALGASPWTLARGLLAEPVLLVVAGAGLGAVVAVWSTRYVVPSLTLPAVRFTPPYLDVSPDWRVLAVTVSLALAGALLAAAIPAGQLFRQGSVPTAVRTASRSPGAARSMRALLVLQVALSSMLLATAALLGRSFVQLATQDPGFERSRVLVLTVSGNFGAGRDAQFATVEEIRRKLAALPEVAAVSASMVTPISGQQGMAAVSVPGARADPVPTLANRVSPGHFEVYGTRLLSGRDFDARDSAAAAPVAIVTQAFAARYFAGDDPVGRTILLNSRATTVVGLAADAKQLTLRESAAPFVYAPLAQWAAPGISTLRFAVRTREPALRYVVLADALSELNRDWTVEIRSLDDDVRHSIDAERLLAAGGSLFAVLALTIGMVGTYGVLSYGVASRRREIGVRLALGAAPAAIWRRVVGEALAVVGAGLALGTVGALVSGRLIERFLFELSGRDPATLTLAAGVMLAAAIAAAGLPAARAARTDPAMALRRE